MEAEQENNAAIRTPDQRLRVFVSSTLSELAEERAAVARAISALRLTPVLFELGAQSHPPRALYRAYLAQSDIFIGLYWQRYGWIGPGMGISGLEDEFRLSFSLPRLLYVKTPATHREARLTAMIDEIQSNGTVTYRSFRTPRELGRLVRTDLAVLLSERFSAGSHAAHSPSATGKGGQRLPASLPVATTSLIGREHDVEEVSRLLDTPGVRLVTLSGPGGIGKTRLAIAVAARVEPRYSGGAVFVPLASVTRPELVLRHVAAAMGATIEGTRPPLEVVVEHLGELPTLLVLDNLEQLLGVGPELDQLLARCPGLKILATSRTVLRLRAEREYPVPPLTVPAFQGRRPLEELAVLPAVQLFVDRARAVRYDFALTADNASAVAEICRRLDGLPLAIELAAARARILEPQALLVRLGGILDGLGQGSADLPERQRTLRATIEWSIALLDEAERRMIAALSAFVDGWTMEAAVQVTGLSEQRALDLLDALARHSLVTVDTKKPWPRFRMFSSIRELAAERLAASTDRADIERRHARYFGALVENASWPEKRQAEWAERLRAEEGNLEIAIRWFLNHDPAPLPNLFRILWLFWQMHDGLAEGRKWIEELQVRADALDERGRVELALISAVTAGEVGDDEGALAAIAGLDGLAGRTDAPFLESEAQLAIAWVRPILDDFEGALKAALTAVDGFRRQNEPLLGWAALTAGLLELALGRHDAARVHLTEALALGGELGNHWLASTARTQLASLAAVSGHFDEARALLRASVDDPENAVLSTQAVTFSLVAHAQLALAEGDPQTAALALGAADGLRQRVGLRPWPSARRSEAQLLVRLKTTLDPEVLEKARATGFRLDRDDAIALIRSASLDAPASTAIGRPSTPKPSKGVPGRRSGRSGV
jgi:predicted ATPase